MGTISSKTVVCVTNNLDCQILLDAFQFLHSTVMTEKRTVQEVNGESDNVLDVMTSWEPQLPVQHVLAVSRCLSCAE